MLLRDSGIAPRHFGLRLDEGIWRVQNLGGASLEVDGYGVAGEAVIAPGSEIRAGDVTFFFAPADRWEDSSAAAGAASMPITDAGAAIGGYPGYVLDVPTSSGGPSAAVLIVGGVLIVAAVVFLLLRAG